MVQKLICHACSYANEVERVYCHNCGAKLDRSALPKVDPHREKREAKRVKNLVKPKNPIIFRFVSGLFNTLVLAFFASLAILAFWPPAKLPTKPSDDERLTAPQLNLVLERAVASPTVQTLDLDEKTVNSYIANRIRSKPTKLIAGLEARNEAVYVTFRNQLVNITACNQVGSIPTVFTTRYSLSIKDGNLVAKLQGGAIGRAPVHPMLMNSIEQLIFASIWKALNSEKNLVGKMQNITIQDGRIIIVSTPGRLALGGSIR